MALDPITELESLVDVFHGEAIAYALCGGLALAVHGHPRATYDIDVLIEAAELDRARAAAQRVGFDVPGTGTPREIHHVSKLDPETGALLALDLLVVNRELESVWSSRQTFQMGERNLVVVSRDGLATMKKLAGRHQDLADLAKLAGTEDDDQA